MEYPLIVEGKDWGAVRVYSEGLFTVFEAGCRAYEGILRLSVYGQGREGYLGVMQPWKDGLFLRRKLSRSRMKDFPEQIEYAAPAGLSDKPRISKPAAPAPGEKEDEQCWHRYSDGSLVCREGSSFLIALPAELRKPSPGAVLREIDGRLYMLFRY